MLPGRFPTTPPRWASFATLALLSPNLAYAEANEDRSTERYQFATEEATPDDGDKVQTYTPTLTGPSGHAEIVLQNANGDAVGASGLLQSGQYTVGDGLLHAGGQYEWEARAPVGVEYATAIPEMESNGNTIYVGPAFTRYDQVQSPRAFTVGTNVGAHQATEGLYTRFWSMTDVDQYDDPLPPELMPSAGTRVPPLGLEAYLSEFVSKLCIGARECMGPIQNGHCQSGEFRETQVRCGATHHVSLMPEADNAALSQAHLDVEHNIEGKNVASTFSITLNSDLAGTSGFAFSTAEEYGITAGFGLHTAFATRSLGTIRVPETGSYVFGTRSSGGARLYIYDSTEEDLGKTLVTEPDAWKHPEIDGDCYGESDRSSYDNKLVNSWSPWNNPNTYYDYEYHESDHSWWQPEQTDFDLARHDLTDNCGIDAAVEFGEPIHLEAGRDYPVQFDAWFGPVEGRLEIRVTRPNGQSGLLPFAWLSAADASVYDYDRVVEPAPPAGAKVQGTAFALSGVGHTLAALDPRKGLNVYESNGLGAWADPVSIALEGMSFGETGVPIRMQFDPHMSTVADLPGSSGSAELIMGPDGGRLRSKLVMSSYVQYNDVEEYTTAEIEAFEFTVDTSGQAAAMPMSAIALSATVHFRAIQNGHTLWDETHPLELVRGTADRHTGAVSLELSGHHSKANVRIVMGPDRDEERELSTDPLDAEFSTPIGTGKYSVRGNSRLGTFVETAPGEYELGGEIFIHQNRLLMDGFCDPLMGWCEDPVWTHRYLDVDGFAFRFNAGSNDVVQPIFALNASGTIRVRSTTKNVTEAIQGATGTFNVQTGDLDVVFEAAGESVALTLTVDDYGLSGHTFHESSVAMDDLGTTIVVAPDRIGPLEADAFIVSKIDNCEPFSNDNVTITSVGAALDEAGIARPYASLPAYRQALPIPGSPSGTRQTLFANNPEHVGRILENDYAYLEWTADGELAVRSVENGETFWSSNTKDQDAGLNWQGDGNLVIYSGGSAIWSSRTHNAPRGLTLRLIGTQAVILSESGVVRWSTPAGPEVPVRGAASQAVKITPDGRTIAVQQVTEAGLRIDLLDRETPSSPWVATGSFPIEGSDSVSTRLPTNAFAIGADAPAFNPPGDFCWMEDSRPYTTRFLAYPKDASGNTITVLSQWTAGQPWVEVVEFEGHSDVSSMAFDHWAENLAIGEPSKGKVTLYTRPNWWDIGYWELTREFQPNGRPNFGAKVEYTFGVLGISDDDSIRFYRRMDMSPEPDWESFHDWATFTPRGEASDNHYVAFSVGGDAVTVINSAAIMSHASPQWFVGRGLFENIDNFRR